MLSIEQIQSAINTIKAENRLLARLVERRKQRLTEGDGEYEYKGHYERPVFAVPGLDAVLVGTEQEAEELMAAYKL